MTEEILLRIMRKMRPIFVDSYQHTWDAISTRDVCVERLCLADSRDGLFGGAISGACQMAAGGDDPTRNDQGDGLRWIVAAAISRDLRRMRVFFQNPASIHPIMKETRILGG